MKEITVRSVEELFTQKGRPADVVRILRRPGAFVMNESEKWSGRKLVYKAFQYYWCKDYE